MSAAVTVAPAVRARTEAAPSFPGIVRGELFKISRQWAAWIMFALLLVIIAIPYLVLLGSSTLKAQLQQAPLQTLYEGAGDNLLVLRVFAGLLLIVLTTRLIGMEYSSGTIRVLLSRGVGRLQLLFAKLLTVSLVALAILVVGIALDALLTVLTVGAVAGNLDPLKSLNSGFWADMGVYVGTIAISMAATILMAAAVTVLTRSLAGGLALGLGWFPADNIGLIFFFLAFRLTRNTFWTVVTGDFLGPNLNSMPGAVLPARAQAAAFASDSTITTLTPVTGAHTLLVTGIYCAVFAVVAIVLTWKRDVKE